jgi:hypothetical protein
MLLTQGSHDFRRRHQRRLSHQALRRLPKAILLAGGDAKLRRRFGFQGRFRPIRRHAAGATTGRRVASATSLLPDPCRSRGGASQSGSEESVEALALDEAAEAGRPPKLAPIRRRCEEESRE